MSFLAIFIISNSTYPRVWNFFHDRTRSAIHRSAERIHANIARPRASAFHILSVSIFRFQIFTGQARVSLPSPSSSLSPLLCLSFAMPGNLQWRINKISGFRENIFIGHRQHNYIVLAALYSPFFRRRVQIDLYTIFPLNGNRPALEGERERRYTQASR